MSRENDRHFTQIDTADGSAFTSKFPVDLRNKTVKNVVTETIPKSLDDIFLRRGSVEEYATIAKKGALPLAPRKLEKYGDEDGVQFVCRALTDGKTPELTQLLYDRHDGFITDFSLVVKTVNGNGVISYYDLRGSLEHENEEDSVFEIAEIGQKPSEPTESLPLDEETARNFIAAINAQRTGSAENGTLQSMLTEIMDASPAVHKMQAGSYANDEKDFNVSIEREEVITRGLGSLASYMVTIDERGVSNAETGVRMTRGFDLSYKLDRTPHYEARLSSFTFDPEKRLTGVERANGYEALSSGLRAKPEIIFKALDIAVTSLLSID